MISARHFILLALPLSLAGCNSTPKTEVAAVPTVVPTATPVVIIVVATPTPTQALPPQSTGQTPKLAVRIERMESILANPIERKKVFAGVVSDFGEDILAARTLTQAFDIELDLDDMSRFAEEGLNRAILSNDGALRGDFAAFVTALDLLMEARQSKANAFNSGGAIARVHLNTCQQHISQANLMIDSLFATPAQKNAEIKRTFDETSDAMKRAEQRKQ